MTKIFAFSYLALLLSRKNLAEICSLPDDILHQRARMLSCSAFSELNGNGNGDGKRRAPGYYSVKEKNRSFDRGSGYEPARLSISDFNYFSPHFYRTERSSHCRTRVTDKTYETSPSLAQTSIRTVRGLRQMKKLFCTHR